MTEQAPIIIGNDGSDFSDVALRRGLNLARKLGVPAKVIRAWTVSTAPRPKSWVGGYVPPAEDFEAAVMERLTRDSADVVVDFPDVQITYETPHGAAGRELIRLSEGATALVVGTRGQGGFAGLLIGSVSVQCVEHAKCDVYVVRKRSGDQMPGRKLPLDQALNQD